MLTLFTVNQFTFSPLRILCLCSDSFALNLRENESESNYPPQSTPTPHLLLLLLLLNRLIILVDYFLFSVVPWKIVCFREFISAGRIRNSLVIMLECPSIMLPHSTDFYWKFHLDRHKPSFCLTSLFVSSPFNPFHEKIKSALLFQSHSRPIYSIQISAVNYRHYLQRIYFYIGLGLAP